MSNWIKTPRLSLRPLRYDDAEQVYSLTSCPDVAKYMRFSVHTSRQETQTLMEEYLEQPGILPFVVEERETGNFVGLFVFKEDSEQPGIYSLTTFSGKKFWNHGYNTEVLWYMAAYARDVLHARGLRAYVVERNCGSVRSLDKNGFSIIQRIPIDHLQCDLLVFGLDFPVPGSDAI